MSSPVTDRGEFFSLRTSNKRGGRLLAAAPPEVPDQLALARARAAAGLMTFSRLAPSAVAVDSMIERIWATVSAGFTASIFAARLVT